jgi:hypothetical protein
VNNYSPFAGRRESHRKQMHVITPSLLEWNHAAITWLCTAAGVSNVWMQVNVRPNAVSTLNCALCPLLAVSCGDAGLGLFTLTVSSPRMGFFLYTYFLWHDMDRIENNASNSSSNVAFVSVATITLLPSRCLATRGDHIYRYKAMIYKIRLLRWSQVPWYAYQVS